MALDFKQQSKNPFNRKYPRNRKRFKEYKGEHLSNAKLLKGSCIGDLYSYPRVNMNRWLSKQVDRPIDKVFSDFVKEFKKTYRGDYSPEKFFYQQVDKEKEIDPYWSYGRKYYVSESGILCRYSKYSKRNLTPRVFKERRKVPKSHIDYNKRAMNEIKLENWELGPKYLGKLWATAKGYTKIMNVWIVSTDKLRGKSLLRDIPKKQRLYLEQFTPANVAGFGISYVKWVYKESLGQIPISYTFIVKLSDLQ